MTTPLMDSVSALLASNDTRSSRESVLRRDLGLALARALTDAGQTERAFEVLAGLTDESAGERAADLAAAWSGLAQASAQRPEYAQRAEQAYRRAAELGPTRGLADLAQYLARQQRLTEAVAVWRAAISADPKEPGAYLNLARVYERLGDPGAALATCLALVAEVPSPRNYLVVAARTDELVQLAPDPVGKQVRIALLGNATLDHLQSYLKVECLRAGLQPVIYQPGFDQVTQEVLNPNSGLYAFKPDVLICAVHASRTFPRLHDDPSELSKAEREAEVTSGLDALGSLLTAFTEQSSALVLLHNMVVPQHPALDILDWRQEPGQAELFAQINARLAELVRTRHPSVHLIDEERIQARVGKARATDPRLWFTARVAWSDEVHLALTREYLRFLKAYTGLNRKCIVLDLDNTLWGGVVGEDGLHGIQLGPDAPGNAFVAFQRELERLWRRGILLAVCSKNDPRDAMPVFEKHSSMVLRSDQIAAWRINWQPKPANLREIAAELNIGLDSLVFLDDNPVERAAVRAELPEVLVPELPADPALYRAALLDLDVFGSLALTSEDRQRGRLYAEQGQRRRFEASARSRSLEDYLSGLEMVVAISPASAETTPRIAQLTNKTNQFNLTTRRYSEADITAMQAGGSEVFGMRVSDRFGDNGLVGVIILGPPHDGARDIDTLLLSCRVMGRGVETALLAFAAQHATASGASRLRGRFIPTAKNAPAAECYARHGFTQVGRQPDGVQLWELDVRATPLEPPAWLTVRFPELVG